MTGLIQKIAFSLDKSSHVTISFNDTGFCSVLSNNFTKLQDDIQIHKKSINGILSQNTVYHCINEQQQQSRFSGFTKVPSTNILNESIFASPYFQHGQPTTMFRASASNHRQHKHLTIGFVTDTRSINTLSL
jgi:hypothetical protein